MKRLLYVLLSLIILISFTACGRNDDVTAAVSTESSVETPSMSETLSATVSVESSAETPSLSETPSAAPAESGQESSYDPNRSDEWNTLNRYFNPDDFGNIEEDWIWEGGPEYSGNPGPVTVNGITLSLGMSYDEANSAMGGALLKERMFYDEFDYQPYFPIDADYTYENNCDYVNISFQAERPGGLDTDSIFASLKSTGSVVAVSVYRFYDPDADTPYIPCKDRVWFNSLDFMGVTENSNLDDIVATLGTPSTVSLEGKSIEMTYDFVNPDSRIRLGFNFSLADNSLTGARIVK